MEMARSDLTGNGIPGARQTSSWFVFGLMSSVTFVGVYALASAVFAVPLISVTLVVNGKLLLPLAGFAVSNLVVAISSTYGAIVSCRIPGGLLRA